MNDLSNYSIEGISQNNPTNIIAGIGYVGEIDSTNNFARFSEVEYGLRAWFMNFATKILKHPTWTISDYINSFAPPSENNTSQYLINISSWTGFSPDLPLPRDVASQKILLRAQIRQETGNDGSNAVTDAMINDGAGLFIGDYKGKIFSSVSPVLPGYILWVPLAFFLFGLYKIYRLIFKRK